MVQDNGIINGRNQREKSYERWRVYQSIRHLWPEGLQYRNAALICR